MEGFWRGSALEDLLNIGCVDGATEKHVDIIENIFKCFYRLSNSDQVSAIEKTLHGYVEPLDFHSYEFKFLLQYCTDFKVKLSMSCLEEILLKKGRRTTESTLDYCTKNEIKIKEEITYPTFFENFF